MDSDDLEIKLKIAKQRTIQYSIIGIFALAALFMFFYFTSVHNVPSSTHANATAVQATQASNSSYSYFSLSAPFGHTLYRIDSPLNSTQLNIINHAPQSYFDTAAEMILNGSLQIPLFVVKNNTPVELYEGSVSPLDAPSIVQLNKSEVSKYMGNKAAFIYLGSITCVFCGDSRLAMELALSRFGSFKDLYYGYSSFGDADLPTFYFAPEPYNSSGLDDVTNYYNGSINLVTIEDINPITGGFDLNPLTTITSNVFSSKNEEASNAMTLINSLLSNSTTQFSGTPYVIAGDYLFKGVPGINFGVDGTTPNNIQGTYIQDLRHSQILQMIANPNTQLAWGYYAIADIYIAALCKSMGNSAPACTPQMQSLEQYV